MEYQDLAVERRGRITSVVLNRPERMNAVRTRTNDELLECFTSFRDDDEQWVLLISGAGDKAFCSGLDVAESAEQSAASGETEGYTTFRPWVDVLQEITKPIICAVNGFCVGGAWHFVADSDIVIASDNAAFLDTHVNVGLINGVEAAGFAWKMPLGIVMRMVIEGRHFRVNAERAYQLGLVSEIVPLDSLMARGWEIATRVAEESAPLAVRGSKKAIHQALTMGYRTGIQEAWAVLGDIHNSEDTLEGYAAFAEKRKPNFQGR